MERLISLNNSKIFVLWLLFLQKNKKKIQKQNKEGERKREKEQGERKKNFPGEIRGSRLRE